MQYIFLHLFAEAYNCGAYGAGGYNNNTCTTATTGGNAAGGAGGALAYTGEPWFWVLAAALVIVAVSAFVLIRNKRKK